MVLTTLVTLIDGLAVRISHEIKWCKSDNSTTLTVHSEPSLKKIVRVPPTETEPLTDFTFDGTILSKAKFLICSHTLATLTPGKTADSYWWHEVTEVTEFCF